MYPHLIDFVQAFLSLGGAAAKLKAMQPGWEQDPP